MDLEDLNKQMNMFNVDYYKEPATIQSQNTRQHEEQWKKQQMADYQQRINEINFTQHNGNGINSINPDNPETILAAQQIKRPTKSDTTRNEINSKMAALNSFLPPQPPSQFQHHQQQHLPQNLQSLNQSQNLPQYQPQNQTQHLERKTDYRQNVNSRIDNFIFDNPIPVKPHPILQQFEQQYQQHQNGNTGQSGNGFHRDSRMVIQDSNKDFYRQEANNRMAEYSPLSRASNCPISMANLSVNDFYNSNPSGNTQLNNIEEDAMAVLNNRLSNYAPLAATINLNSSKSEFSPLDYFFNSTQYNPMNPNNVVQRSSKPSNPSFPQPKTWNNINLPQQNAVFTEHPVYSNSGNKRG